MICLNCKKQIPDDSLSCPFCKNEVNYERQILNEIKFRRYQRYAFYFIISLVFLGMVGVIYRIYSANTELIKNLTVVKVDLEKKKAALSELEGGVKKETEEKNIEIEKKTEELKRTMEEKAAAIGLLEKEKDGRVQAEKSNLLLSASNAAMFKTIVKLGEGVANKELYKFPVAGLNVNNGKDTDSDGLSDDFEAAIRTDINKEDTDGDGFGDKNEILGGFNPLGKGKQAINMELARKLSGKILLQVENYGEAWYIGFDGKRYFLGRPVEAIENSIVVESISTSSVESLDSAAAATSSESIKESISNENGLP